MNGFVLKNSKEYTIFCFFQIAVEYFKCVFPNLLMALNFAGTTAGKGVEAIYISSLVCFWMLGDFLVKKIAQFIVLETDIGMLFPVLTLSNIVGLFCFYQLASKIDRMPFAKYVKLCNSLID